MATVGSIIVPKQEGLIKDLLAAQGWANVDGMYYSKEQIPPVAVLTTAAAFPFLPYAGQVSYQQMGAVNSLLIRCDTEVYAANLGCYTYFTQE